MKSMDKQAFHSATATMMWQSYANDEHAPDGWREIMAWHWEQAGDYRQAVEAALEVVEARVSELAFTEARRWTERGLTLLDRLDEPERRNFESRAYALTIAVLEFGGQYREALGYARLLMRLAENLGNVEAQLRSYLTMGRVNRELGQFVVAESNLVQALMLAQRHNLLELESEVRLQLAKVHQLQGKHLQAFQQLEMAQEVPTDDRGQLARVYTGVGDIYRVLSASQEALKLYKRALKLDTGSGNRLGQAMLNEKLGLTHLEIRNFDKALHYVREALRLREELEDVIGQARSHVILGRIASSLADYTLAMSHFERAYELEGMAQNQRGLTIALMNLGDVARALNDHERARSVYAEALAQAQAVGDQIAQARVYQRLGDVSRHIGDNKAAQSYWTAALRIREQLGHSEEAIALRGCLTAVGLS